MGLNHWHTAGLSLQTQILTGIFLSIRLYCRYIGIVCIFNMLHVAAVC